MIRSGVVVAVDEALPHTTRSDKPAQQRTTIDRSSLQAPTSKLTVQLDTLVGCGSCSAAGGCGVQLLPSANKPVRIDCPLPPNSDVGIGQFVQVSIPEPSQGWLLLVLSAYGWPTLGMLGGAVTGFWAATLLNVTQHQELFSIIGFAAGLSGGLLAWDRMNKSGELVRTHAKTGELTGELLPPAALSLDRRKKHENNVT